VAELFFSNQGIGTSAHRPHFEGTERPFRRVDEFFAVSCDHNFVSNNLTKFLPNGAHVPAMTAEKGTTAVGIQAYSIVQQSRNVLPAQRGTLQHVHYSHSVCWAGEG